MKDKNHLTRYILIGLILGVIAGYMVNKNMARPESFADAMSLITTLFLRLIKMIIAPLVFSTLVVGIAKMGNVNEVGRVGVKALSWFMLASFIALPLGLFMVNLFRPGDAMHALLPASDAASGIASSHLSLSDFVSHLVPSSIVDGMAKNEILQIVVFAIFFVTAAAAVGERGAPLISAIDGLAHIMLKITSYVMKFAPVAVFAAVARVVAESGLATYGVFAAVVAKWEGELGPHIRGELVDQALPEST